MNGLDIVVPVVAIIVGIGGPVLAVVLATYYSHRTRVARYEAVKHALDGNLTPEQVDRMVQVLGRPEESRVGSRRKRLSSGIVLLCLAIAFGLAYLIAGTGKAILFPALVVGFIGIANIAIAILVQKDPGGDSE